MNKNVFLEELKNLFKDLDELNNIKFNFLKAPILLNKNINEVFDEKTELLHSFQEEMLKKVDFYRLNRIEIIDKEVFLALDKWNNKIKLICFGE